MIEKCEIYKDISKLNKPSIGILIPESYSPLKKLSIFYNAIYHGVLFGWQYDLHINFKKYIFKLLCVEKDIATQNLRLWLLPFIQKT